jgi:hypothetical protein
MIGNQKSAFHNSYPKGLLRNLQPSEARNLIETDRAAKIISTLLTIRLNRVNSRIGKP